MKCEEQNEHLKRLRSRDCGEARKDCHCENQREMHRRKVDGL